MKLISRTTGEQVIIDGHVTVTVKSIRDDRVVLSIESPLLVPPYREEVILRDEETDSPSMPETLTRSLR